MIASDANFTLHLVGNNVITMVDGTESYAYGIRMTNSSKREIAITAAQGGTLTITTGATPLTKSFYGIYGRTTFYSGTVNIAITVPRR